MYYQSYFNQVKFYTQRLYIFYILVRPQKHEMKHSYWQAFIQIFLLRSIFATKIKFLESKALGAEGPEKHCELPCVGFRADIPVGRGYFIIY